MLLRIIFLVERSFLLCSFFYNHLCLPMCVHTCMHASVSACICGCVCMCVYRDGESFFVYSGSNILLSEDELLLLAIGINNNIEAS